MSSSPLPAAAKDAVRALRRHAAEVAAVSHVPFSGQPEGAALLLSDGRWVAGARVESATFPLTIPALQAAYVAAVGAGHHDIVAVALSRTALPGEFGWIAQAVGVEPHLLGDDALAFAELLPMPAERLDVRLDASTPADDAEGVGLARGIASHAFIPFSDYPVGCVLLYELDAGGAALVPGVNVEHPDWTRGLCAERSALATARSLGPGTVRRGYLSCLRDPDGTPCGACRQLLVELLPDGTLALDRGSEPPERVTPRQLLPGSFSGERLRR
jgi:cytidine deaminase